MMNQTGKNQTSLEDFEEFDLRDAINVAVYGFMSVGEPDCLITLLSNKLLLTAKSMFEGVNNQALLCKYLGPSSGICFPYPTIENIP